MSVLRLACPSCHGLLQVAESLVGKRIRCPGCHVPVQIGTPLQSADAWFIHRPQAMVGPYAWVQIQQMAHWGVLGPHDLVKRDGESQWTPLAQIQKPSGPSRVPVAGPPLATPVGGAAPEESRLDADAEMLLMGMLEEQGANEPSAPKGGPVRKAKPVRTTSPVDKDSAVWVVEEGAGPPQEGGVTDTSAKHYPPGHFPAPVKAPARPRPSRPVEDDEPSSWAPLAYFAAGMAAVIVALVVVILLLSAG